MKQWDDDAGGTQNDQRFFVDRDIGYSFHSIPVADPGLRGD